MQKILITGAGGFVGSYLIDLLKHKYQIIGLTYPQSLENQPNVIFYTGDITNPEFLEDIFKRQLPDGVIHLAALPQTWNTQVEEVFKTNFYGTYNLYQAILKIKEQQSYQPKILYVSSSEVYGKTLNPACINEQSPFFPVNFYAVSKVAADRLSYQYSQSNKLQIAIVRPFPHTGPSQKLGFFVPDMASQIAEIEKGKKPPVVKVGNLDATRDISDVRDVIKAYQLIIESNFTPGEAFNICSGQGQIMEEVLDKLLKLAAVAIKTELDQSRIRLVDIPTSVGDNRKITALGWKPEVDFGQTLKDVLGYWRKIH